MYWQILGSLAVDRAPGITVVTAPKTRTLLAMLLVRANQAVSASSLAEELWCGHLPRSALTTLQTYVLQARRMFAAGLEISQREVARELLITRASGYQLILGSDQLDLNVFEQLVHEGRSSIAKGSYHRAATLLQDALTKWRGDALADVQAGPSLQVEAMRLNEVYLTVVEQWIEVQLQLGRNYEVLGDLTALVARHPLNENLHGLFMIALHRVGRRSLALKVYRELRIALIEELGVEPSPRAQRIHQGILTSDPAIDGPSQDYLHPLKVG